MAETTSSPKPARSWLQFSLRTFFVLLTIVCLSLGWLTHKARQQQKAVSEIEKLGGTAYYDFEVDENGQPTFEGKRPGPEWLHKWIGADFVHDVICVDLSGTEADDLQILAGLKKIKRVYLWNAPVTDVTPLVELKTLLWVDLEATKVTDALSLAELHNLERLDLSSTRVDKQQKLKLRRALPDCYILP